MGEVEEVGVFADGNYGDEVSHGAAGVREECFDGSDGESCGMLWERGIGGGEK